MIKEQSLQQTLNLAEAAQFLRLGVNATKALLDDGTLPGVSLNQKHTVFLRRDLEQYIHDTAVQQSEARRKLAEARNTPEPEAIAAGAAPRPRPGQRRKIKPFDMRPYEIQAGLVRPDGVTTTARPTSTRAGSRSASTSSASGAR